MQTAARPDKIRDSKSPRMAEWISASRVANPFVFVFPKLIDGLGEWGTLDISLFKAAAYASAGVESYMFSNIDDPKDKKVAWELSQM